MHYVTTAPVCMYGVSCRNALQTAAVTRHRRRKCGVTCRVSMSHTLPSYTSKHASKFCRRGTSRSSTPTSFPTYSTSDDASQYFLWSSVCTQGISPGRRIRTTTNYDIDTVGKNDGLLSRRDAQPTSLKSLLAVPFVTMDGQYDSSGNASKM